MPGAFTVAPDRLARHAIDREDGDAMVAHVGDEHALPMDRDATRVVQLAEATPSGTEAEIKGTSLIEDGNAMVALVRDKDPSSGSQRDTVWLKKPCLLWTCHGGRAGGCRRTVAEASAISATASNDAAAQTETADWIAVVVELLHAVCIVRNE